MASWTGILGEAEDKIESILGAEIEGIAKRDELPDLMPAEDDIIYTADLHGGGTAIEPESGNYQIPGSTTGSAREKEFRCDIQAVAKSKDLARSFVEGIWNALPQEPDARPIYRIWAETEPDMIRGTYKMEQYGGAERQVWAITCTLVVMLYKGD